MSEQPYPWANAPREFRANAMPAGDLKNGVPGPIVAVREYIKGAGRGGSIRTVKINERLYSRAEAIMLRDGLNAAIRAFELAERLAQDVAFEVAGAPRAYQGPWPIRGQTLADVGFGDCVIAAGDKQ